MKHLFILTVTLFIYSSIHSQAVIRTSKYTSCNDCEKEVCVVWEIIEKENPEKMMEQYHQLYLKVHLNTDALLLGEFKLRYRVSNDIYGNYSNEKTISIPLYSLEQFMEAHEGVFYLGEAFKGYTKDIKTQLVCDPDPNETKIQGKNNYLSVESGWNDASEIIDIPVGYRKVEDKNSGCIYITNYDEMTHVTWDGECNGKLMNGFGILYGFKNEEQLFNFEGHIQQGLLNGEGAITWDNGNTYTGEWVDGFFNGQGTFTWANGNKYTGKWVDGLKNGQGTFIWTNGDTYAGQWVDDKRNGFGVLDWVDTGVKCHYEGDFHNNMMHGEGTVIMTGIMKYVGQFENGNKSGYGTIYYEDDLLGTYKGEFKNGAPHGKGESVDRKGTVFKGEYKNGILYNGTAILKNGTILATYKNGIIQ
jgi:hypothetical protein